jgi:AraC family transcriptional regulator of adaptative response/methylated-DNA-[protein]-cysteine methyltransferase
LRAYRDGPLRARRPEEIAYATARCPLGHVLVASGSRGIVAIIVRRGASALLPELRSEFPKAALDRSAKVPLAKVVAYIAAPFGPFKLQLDMRGTAFQQAVWREVRKIPAGETSSYSAIAEAIGAPKAVRAVASSCTSCRFAFAVPCHRVVSKVDAKPGDAGARRRRKWLAYEARLLSRSTAAPVPAFNTDGFAGR